jgi:hypothetical protein
VREGIHVGFLDGIFGFAVVPQDAASDPIKPLIVPLHNNAERPTIAGKRTPHEFGIVRSDRNTRRRR